MNPKKLFAGAIAAVVLSTGLVTEVSAQPPSNGSQPQIMAGRGHAALNLTPEQEAQMKQIRSSTRAQIETVLTPAQKEQLNAVRGEERGQGRGRGHRRQIWEQLNLTPQQQAQIDRIRQESKEKMNAVLTPQQREQLQQMRQNRHQNRRQS